MTAIEPLKENHVVSEAAAGTLASEHPVAANDGQPVPVPLAANDDGKAPVTAPVEAAVAEPAPVAAAPAEVAATEAAAAPAEEFSLTGSADDVLKQHLLGTQVLRYGHQEKVAYPVASVELTQGKETHGAAEHAATQGEHVALHVVLDKPANDFDITALKQALPTLLESIPALQAHLAVPPIAEAKAEVTGEPAPAAKAAITLGEAHISKTRDGHADQLSVDFMLPAGVTLQQVLASIIAPKVEPVVDAPKPVAIVPDVLKTPEAASTPAPEPVVTAAQVQGHVNDNAPNEQKVANR